jgi:flagellar export protein FliJ
MSFRFSLAAVLKYREALELREFAALERVQQEIARLEANIDAAEKDRLALVSSRAEDLTRGMRALHLQDAIERELILERYQNDLRKKQHELTLKRQELLKAYDESRLKRELLEKLRDRKFAEYVRSQTKAEQATIDDLFLARRQFK